MTAQHETTARLAAGAEMPFCEKYLSVSVAFCTVVGIALGRLLPPAFDALVTVAGGLVAVPVMLSIVWIVNRLKPWYEARIAEDVQ